MMGIRNNMRGVTAMGAVVLALSAMACASTNEIGPSAPSSSVPSSSASSGRQEVPAPIDGVGVRVLESNPPQYMLNVRAGLPGGCAQKNRHEMQRAAEAITVNVLNWMPTGNPPCTMIYGSYEVNINLGSDFQRGTTYSVSVNDKRTTFVAQ
jgi:hypothetical protein